MGFNSGFKGLNVKLRCQKVNCYLLKDSIQLYLGVKTGSAECSEVSLNTTIELNVHTCCTSLRAGSVSLLAIGLASNNYSCG